MVVLQTTKKRNCPAVITIREYIFPQYSVSEESLQSLSKFGQRILRASKLKELSDALLKEKRN